MLAQILVALSTLILPSAGTGSLPPEVRSTHPRLSVGLAGDRTYSRECCNSERTVCSQSMRLSGDPLSGDGTKLVPVEIGSRPADPWLKLLQRLRLQAR